MNKKNIKEWILSLQILLACVGATTFVPVLVGFPPSTALFTAGLGTLLFGVVTKNKVPAFLGSSFAFITPMTMIINQYGFEYSCGGFIVVGLIYILFALIIYKVGIEKVSRLLPSHITGSMIIIIGLSLVPSAITNIQGNIGIAIITLVTSLGVIIFGKGFFKQLGIMLALIVGYVISAYFGLVDFTSITQANIVSLPHLVIPQFDLSAILIIAPVAVVTMLEHIGDITTLGTVTNKDYIKEPGIHKTLIGDGLATALGGLFGSVGNTTYGESTSVLALTKQCDPKLTRRAGILAIILSLCGFLSGALQTIPSFVVGAISLQLYFMISWVGFKSIKDNKSYKSIKNLIIIAVMLIIGLGNITLTIGVVTLSSLALSAIVGVILNLVLNHKDM